MSKYNVEIIEFLSRVVEIDAKNFESAVVKAEELYNNEDIILDYEDKIATNYKPYPSQKVKNNFSLNLDYDKKNDSISISCDGGTCTKYSCKTKDDIESALKNYIDIYINFEKVQPEKYLSKER